MNSSTIRELIQTHRETLRASGSAGVEDRIDDLEKDVARAERAGDRQLLVRSIFLLLQCVAETSRHSDVLEIANRGLRYSSELGLQSFSVAFLLTKARRYLRIVALESAMLALRDANALAEQLGDQGATAEVLRLLGVMHGLAGDIELAERNFRRSIEIFHSLSDTSGFAEATGGLAIAAWRQNRLEEAARLYQVALDAAIESENWVCAIQAASNLAAYYLKLDALGEANRVLLIAEEISDERGFSRFWASALLIANRAGYYEKIGQFAQAKAAYYTALAICDEIGEAIMRPAIELELSRLLRANGDLEGALKHLELAYDLDMRNAQQGRSLEIQSLRGSLELVQEQRERRLIENHSAELELQVLERTRELRLEVEERRRAESEARHLASHDPLTGLLNRRSFRDLLERAVAGTADPGKFCVLFLDLDQFRHTNESGGHEKGDALLKSVANRLVSLARLGKSVCRFGGDEFVILASDEDAASIMTTVRAVLELFQAPFPLGTDEQRVDPSIGISCFPDDSRNAGDLIRLADIAMQAAKHRATRFAKFDSTMQAAIALRNHLRADLAGALINGQISLAYQPKVDVSTRAFAGLEALARWDHPDHGTLAPLDFIPILEDSGLIREFGRWVIATACAQMHDWSNRGLRFRRVAINVSQRQLEDDTLLDFISSQLEHHKLESHMLEIEITESSLMSDANQVVPLLQKISALGVHISIDDFGTGYSSLSLLTQLPLDSIKIDQSFVRSMVASPEDRAVAQTIIRLAKALGKSVTAEGVEHEDQIAMLRADGCDFCQGFLLGEPLAASALEPRLLSGS